MENFLADLKFDDSIEKFIAEKLSEKRKDILKILETINEDAKSIYIAGLYILHKDKFPAKQSIVSHCFRELINAITRWEESACKQQFIDGLKNVEFIKNGNHLDETINKNVNEIWGKIKPLHNEWSKMHKIILERNLSFAKKLKESNEAEKQQMKKQIDSLIKKTLASKKNIDTLRHFDKTFKTVNEDVFKNYINDIEDFLISLKSNFIDKKEALDEILAKTNTR